MTDPRIKVLLQRAARLTQSNRLPWKEVEREDAFLASFSFHSIKISARPSRQSPDNLEYFISILDEWGDVVEEVGDEDFLDEGATFTLMKNMFESARRIARGVDAALDSILRDMDDLDIPF